MNEIPVIGAIDEIPGLGAIDDINTNEEGAINEMGNDGFSDHIFDYQPPEVLDKKN